MTSLRMAGHENGKIGQKCKFSEKITLCPIFTGFFAYEEEEW